MVDKTAVLREKSNTFVPLGKEYCDVPGTSCWYNDKNICISCRRPKGWRQLKKQR